MLCCVTGVSGSGKSTLVHSVLHGNLLEALGLPTGEAEIGTVPGDPRRRTPPRSRHGRPVAARADASLHSRGLHGLFETIRKLFAESSDGMARGLTPGYFSFNSGAGRCGRCMGNGFEKVEMQFLSDLYVTCPECEGKRYTPEALEIRLGEKNLDEVLSMTVSESIAWFSRWRAKPPHPSSRGSISSPRSGSATCVSGNPQHPLRRRKPAPLKLVGHLLAKPARKAADGKTSLLLFDEPTTGLHFDDTTMLLRMFDRLVAAGRLRHRHRAQSRRHRGRRPRHRPGTGGRGRRRGGRGVRDAGGGRGLSGIADGTVFAGATGTEVRGQRSEVSRHVTKSLKVAEAAAPYQPLTSDLRLPTSENRERDSLHGARENNLKNLSLTIRGSSSSSSPG